MRLNRRRTHTTIYSERDRHADGRTDRSQYCFMPLPTVEAGHTNRTMNIEKHGARTGQRTLAVFSVAEAGTPRASSLTHDASDTGRTRPLVARMTRVGHVHVPARVGRVRRRVSRHVHRVAPVSCRPTDTTITPVGASLWRMRRKFT